jgi:SAM-dependent methyltransferase
MKLLAFPCGRELVTHFLARLDNNARQGAAALILKKQEEPLRDILSSFGLKEVYALSEDIYGQVSSFETKEILTRIHQKSFTHACFPMNDFCGNVALLLAGLVPHVTAINPTSKEPVEVSLPQSDMPRPDMPRPDMPRPDMARTAGADPAMPYAALSQAQSKIMKRLKAFAPVIRAMASGDHAGERLTGGLIEGLPYDWEVLARYASASRQLQGRVLEIGCGLGIGAYLMAELNPSIRVLAVDNDPQTVELARILWLDQDRLSFEVAEAEGLTFPASSFEAVLCFEVVEHLRQPERLLKEVNRVLVKEGKIIGSTPNPRLYPYRANLEELPGTPDGLRQQGIWPWHYQELDEADIRSLLEGAGFGDFSIRYPTFVSGIDLYNVMRRSTFQDAITHLSHVRWSIADFAVLDSYYPCFSGFSFIFAGRK